LQGKFKLTSDLVNFKSIWRNLVLANYPLLGLEFSKYSRHVEGVNADKALIQYVTAMDEAGIQNKVTPEPEEESEEEEN
jgi:hypothetical protein